MELRISTTVASHTRIDTTHTTAVRGVIQYSTHAATYMEGAMEGGREGGREGKLCSDVFV